MQRVLGMLSRPQRDLVRRLCQGVVPPRPRAPPSSPPSTHPRDRDTAPVPSAVVHAPRAGPSRSYHVLTAVVLPVPTLPTVAQAECSPASFADDDCCRVGACCARGVPMPPSTALKNCLLIGDSVTNGASAMSSSEGITPSIRPESGAQRCPAVPSGAQHGVTRPAHPLAGALLGCLRPLDTPVMRPCCLLARLRRPLGRRHVAAWLGVPDPAVGGPERPAGKRVLQYLGRRHGARAAHQVGCHPLQRGAALALAPGQHLCRARAGRPGGCGLGWQSVV